MNIPDDLETVKDNITKLLNEQFLKRAWDTIDYSELDWELDSSGLSFRGVVAEEHYDDHLVWYCRRYYIEGCVVDFDTLAVDIGEFEDLDMTEEERWEEEIERWYDSMTPFQQAVEFGYEVLPTPDYLPLSLPKCTGSWVMAK